MANETKTVVVDVVDQFGDEVSVSLTVPVTLPSEDRAETLRRLYSEHVRHPDGHWKGRALAVVDPSIADDVADAMDFMGSVVDERKPVLGGTKVSIFSKGYWAHGF